MFYCSLIPQSQINKGAAFLFSWNSLALMFSWSSGCLLITHESPNGERCWIALSNLPFSAFILLDWNLEFFHCISLVNQALFIKEYPRLGCEVVVLSPSTHSKKVQTDPSFSSWSIVVDVNLCGLCFLFHNRMMW